MGTVEGMSLGLLGHVAGKEMLREDTALVTDVPVRKTQARRFYSLKSGTGHMREFIVAVDIH